MSSNWTDSLLTFEASSSSGNVSALLRRPSDARVLYVLGHGAGAGMHHPFMETISRCLARRGVATFRYQFPYMEAGRRAPNPRPILLATVRSAVAAAASAAPDLRLFAGGKSMGGRMTSLAASEDPLPAVAGLIFLGFPLHAAGKPSSERGEHLRKTGLPMLFVQGTRDRLADITLLKRVLDGLQPKPTLRMVEGADHSFKTSGRDKNDPFPDICEFIAAWCDR